MVGFGFGEIFEDVELVTQVGEIRLFDLDSKTSAKNAISSRKSAVAKLLKDFVLRMYH